MGLYNAVFGHSPVARDLLAILGVTAKDFERFRDAFVAEGEIVVYTRLGGANRQTYPHVFLRMYGHPQFLRAVDDKFDNTYCTFYFDIPQPYRERLKEFDIGPWNPDQRWREAMEKLKTDPGEATRILNNTDDYLQVIDGSGNKRTLRDALDNLKKTGEST